MVCWKENAYEANGAVSFYKDKHARMKFIPEQKFPKMVNNNWSKFPLLEVREHPCLLTDPQTPTISTIPEEGVLTYAYIRTTQSLSCHMVAFRYFYHLPFGLYSQMAKTGSFLSRCCCCSPQRGVWVSRGSSEVPQWMNFTSVSLVLTSTWASRTEDWKLALLPLPVSLMPFSC